MAQYIDKDAVVAEIEKLRDEAHSKRYASLFQSGIESGCNQMLSFINTLEVKEVDLEKSISD